MKPVITIYRTENGYFIKDRDERDLIAPPQPAHFVAKTELELGELVAELATEQRGLNNEVISPPRRDAFRAD